MEYLSFSSMKELRNNEGLFLKKYINYEWDNWTYIATIIGKAGHHWVEKFLEDIEMRKLYKKDPKVTMDAVIKNAQQYAKDDYIAKNQKPEDFWNTTKMITFGWYDDIFKLASDKDKLVWDREKSMVYVDQQELDKKIEKIDQDIVLAIRKHKRKDQKLDDFIRYGTTGSIEKILDWIDKGLRNFFEMVYPTIENWKLISAEYNQTLDVCDLDWVVLDLPVKFIVDAVFEDENGDLIIVDWKFKGQLSWDEAIKPEYDMQWSTYFFGCLTAFEKKAKKALIIEIQPKEQGFPYMKQPELRNLCDVHDLDWKTWNNGKYMTNAMMQEELAKKEVIEKAPVVYTYEIDFEEKAYLLDMWMILYKQTIKRLFELLVEKDDFKLNIFDQAFDGWLTVYEQWMGEFIPKDEPEYTEDDAVEL